MSYLISVTGIGVRVSHMIGVSGIGIGFHM